MTTALSDSGFSLDAAIQRLTGLRLHGDDATVAAASAAASGVPEPSPLPANAHSLHSQPGEVLVQTESTCRSL